MLAAPSGSAPIRFGRQRYLTGIAARRSAKDLAPFGTLENAVYEAAQEHNGRAAE